MSIFDKNRAFTLAEVLVTLAIIGVVASLTIPSVMKSYQKMQYETGYKKAYSTLGQATQMIMADNGGTMKGLAITGSEEFKTTFSQYLKTSKVCTNANRPDCWHESTEWDYLNGDAPFTGNDGIGLIETSGMLITFSAQNVNCTASNLNGITNICGVATFDINGFKAPNVVGKDIHRVYIRENSVSPVSSTDATCLSSGNGFRCGVEILNGTYDWEN